MGGYGAIRNGLKYHDTFGCIAGLSSALVIDDMEKWTDSSPAFFMRRSYAQGCFGDLSKVLESDQNPKWLAKKLADAHADIPGIYMACGQDDFLLKQNRDFRDYLTQLGISVTYEEGPGAHEWDFWNTYIKRVLDWLPLGDKNSGIDSGNVGL